MKFEFARNVRGWQSVFEWSLRYTEPAPSARILEPDEVLAISKAILFYPPQVMGPKSREVQFDCACYDFVHHTNVKNIHSWMPGEGRTRFRKHHLLERKWKAMKSGFGEVGDEKKQLYLKTGSQAIIVKTSSFQFFLLVVSMDLRKAEYWKTRIAKPILLDKE